jgi:hypothetical protein
LFFFFKILFLGYCLGNRDYIPGSKRRRKVLGSKKDFNNKIQCRRFEFLREYLKVIGLGKFFDFGGFGLINCFDFWFGSNNERG